MAEATLDPRARSSALQNYYFIRAGVAVVWVVAAFTVGAANPLVGGLLLVIYPAWDALANLIDARANGGLGANPVQATNTVVSLLAALAMAAGWAIGGNAMIAVFGIWAVLAGLLQLVVGVRRWKTFGAQWAMILSGAQSVLAGGFFTRMALGPTPLSVADVAGYAGFGAFYFLVSALWLTFRKPRAA
jgi:hypothetical protein